jgi:hypothetical protein
MTFKTPIGYYREQIEDTLDGKRLTRNQLAELLPHIPPNIITQTLGRMVVDGDVGKDDSAGVRKQVYFIQEHKPKLELPTTKVDNCALDIVWNVAFEKADYDELTV